MTYGHLTWNRWHQMNPSVQGSLSSTVPCLCHVSRLFNLCPYCLTWSPESITCFPSWWCAGPSLYQLGNLHLVMSVIQWIQVKWLGSLKSALVEVFIPQRLANATNCGPFKVITPERQLLDISTPLTMTPEKAMTPHSSTLAWKIPWTEEPGGLQSTGSLRVGHDWATSPSLFTFMHWRRKWQPTPVFLPGESQGQGSLVGFRLWGHTESDMTEAA